MADEGWTEVKKKHTPKPKPAPQPRGGRMQGSEQTPDLASLNGKIVLLLSEESIKDLVRAYGVVPFFEAPEEKEEKAKSSWKTYTDLLGSTPPKGFICVDPDILHCSLGDLKGIFAQKDTFLQCDFSKIAPFQVKFGQLTWLTYSQKNGSLWGILSPESAGVKSVQETLQSKFPTLEFEDSIAHITINKFQKKRTQRTRDQRKSIPYTKDINKFYPESNRNWCHPKECVLTFDRVALMVPYGERELHGLPSCMIALQVLGSAPAPTPVADEKPVSDLVEDLSKLNLTENIKETQTETPTDNQ